LNWFEQQLLTVLAMQTKGFRRRTCINYFLKHIHPIKLETPAPLTEIRVLKSKGKKNNDKRPLKRTSSEPERKDQGPIEEEELKQKTNSHKDPEA